jgi:hypothetical protein
MFKSQFLTSTRDAMELHKLQPSLEGIRNDKYINQKSKMLFKELEETRNITAKEVTGKFLALM